MAAEISGNVYNAITATAASFATSGVASSVAETSSSAALGGNATALPSILPFPFNHPVFTTGYTYFSSSLPRTFTQAFLLPFYLIYQLEVFLLTTLPHLLGTALRTLRVYDVFTLIGQGVLRVSNALRLHWLVRWVTKAVVWLVKDVLGDIEFLGSFGQRGNIGFGGGDMRPELETAGMYVNGEPVTAAGEVVDAFRQGGTWGYFMSRWGLLCCAVTIVILRISVFGRARNPVRLDWKRRFILRAVPLILLSRSASNLLRTMRCQFSPNYAEYLYADASIPLRPGDYGNQPGWAYSFANFLLSPFESEPATCDAMNMLRHNPSDMLPYGSFQLLWELFVRMCVSQTFAALESALQCRKQFGVSMFEHSLMFAEAEGMVANTIASRIARKLSRDAKAAANTQKTATISESIASIVSAVTSTTAMTNLPSETASPGASTKEPSARPAVRITRREALMHMNVSPELLVITLLSVAQMLTANVLAVFDMEQNYRLAHTSFYAIATMAYIFSGLARPSSLMRFPSVTLIGFTPHIFLLLGILVCANVYVVALTITAFSLPDDVPAGITLKERFALASENMQSQMTVRTFRVNRGEDFFSALVRIGYESLTAASRVVFLTEGKQVCANQLTWLEEERLSELMNNRSEGTEGPGSAGLGRDLAAHEELFDVDVVGRDQRTWQSGYGIEKRIETQQEPNGRQDFMSKGRGDAGTHRSADRLWQSYCFWKKIVRLLSGWICFWICKVFDKCGIRYRPNWLVKMAGIPKKEAENPKPLDALGSGGSQEGRQQMAFWVLDENGRAHVPAVSELDVEVEMRKQAFTQERAWSENTEESLDKKLYDWWRGGGSWGEKDATGDYVPDERDEWDDTTSMISMSTNQDDASHSEWESDSEAESGRRTPTQRDPWGVSAGLRRRGVREGTPMSVASYTTTSSRSTGDPIFDMDHLSRLLDPRDEESRNEARILASHLRAANDGRIMTRAQYRKQLELDRARVLTSSRLERAQLTSPTASPSMHENAIAGQPRKPTQEEEAEILERLILNRRLNPPSNPMAQGMSSTFGDSGPQCVICHCAPRSVISWPCRCLTVCEDCRVQCAMNNMARCVTCRRDVTGFARLWVP